MACIFADYSLCGMEGLDDARVESGVRSPDHIHREAGLILIGLGAVGV